ncbi:uncharacterized protein FFNC_15493 [Fusarium fujikuroi]|nr:uncharacterized protein FFC1_08633 [Fusarium fujikuroi]SCO54396.1 uncharacterized protein FFNC_15493 [Fusarium fujikuroi]
MYFWYLIKAR